MRDFKSESDTYKKFKTQFGEIDLRQGMNEELLNLDYTNFEEKSCSDEEFEPFNMNEERQEIKEDPWLQSLGNDRIITKRHKVKKVKVNLLKSAEKLKLLLNPDETVNQAIKRLKTQQKVNLDSAKNKDYSKLVKHLSAFLSEGVADALNFTVSDLNNFLVQMGICMNRSQPMIQVEGAQIQEQKNTSSQPKQPLPHTKSRKRLSIWKINEEEEKDLDNYLEVYNKNKNEFSKSTTANNEKHEQGSIMLLKSRATFKGRASSKRQQGFEDKNMKFQGDSIDKDFLSNIGVAIACKKGLKPESPNQDDFCVVVEQGMLLLSVYDGHGPFGHDVSNFVHTMLPKLITTHPDFEQDTCRALNNSFMKVNEALIMHCDHPGSNFDCLISGTTATLTCIKQGKLYSAHVGDSRGVIAKRQGNRLTAFRLTRDHKPQITEERDRIIRNNGEVKKLEGDIPYRVFVKGKEFPGLSMSRAIGDRISQNIGVICEPEIQELMLGPDDAYLIICSDGVWEFLEDQDVVDIVKRCRTVQQAADDIAQLSWQKWLENEIDVVDDITVIIVDLDMAKSAVNF